MLTLVFPLMMFITSVFHQCEGQNREGPPLIEKFPKQKKLYFIPGEEAQLPCEASGGNITYYWTKSDKFINVEKEKNFTLKSGNLIIITSRDCEGRYQCYASNNFGVSVSDEITLLQAVLKLPEETKETEIKNYIGFPEKMYCKHDSVPRSKVRWFKDKVAITLNDRLLTDEQGTLYFTSLKDDDDGNYTCYISNDKIKNGIYGSINVLSVKDGKEKPPKPTLMWASPSSPEGFLEESLTLKCIVGGKDPSIKWKVSSKNKKGDGSTKPELVLSKLDENDEGKYKCHYDRKDHTFNIKIYSRPRWREKPESVQVKLKSDVKLICEADGNPNATTHWYINAQPIKDFLQQNKDKAISKKIRYKGSQISIDALTPDDMMTIQCVCSNEYGYVFTNVYIFVYGHPTITALTTKISNTVDPGPASITTSHQITSSRLSTKTTTTTTTATTTTTTTTLPPPTTTPLSPRPTPSTTTPTPRTTTPTTSPAFKNDKTSQEAQTKVGAPIIGGAVGGFTALLLIAGIVVFWRCRRSKNKESDSQDVTAFKNVAYDKNGSLPGIINSNPARTSTYDTLDPSNLGKGDTYEQLQPQDSQNMYVEVPDDNLNSNALQTRTDNINEDIVYDSIDDTYNDHKNSDVKHANLYMDLENADDNTMSQTNNDASGDNYFILENQNVVSEDHSSSEEPVVNDENYFVLETSE